jgi:hypothetical protein
MYDILKAQNVEHFHSSYLVVSTQVLAVRIQGGLQVVRIDKTSLDRDPDERTEPVPGQHQATHQTLSGKEQKKTLNNCDKIRVNDYVFKGIVSQDLMRKKRPAYGFIG